MEKVKGDDGDFLKDYRSIIRTNAKRENLSGIWFSSFTGFSSHK